MNSRATTSRSPRGSRSWPSSSRSRTGPEASTPRPHWPREERGRSSIQSCALRCAPTSEEILGGLDSTNTWDAVIVAEPALGVRMSPDQFDAALVAVATFVDLKSPYMLGHATAVSDLVADAGAKLGLGGDDLTTLRTRGVVHGLGRLGVSNSIWDKRGPLGAGERERVACSPISRNACCISRRRLRRSARSRCSCESGSTGRATPGAWRGRVPAGAHPRRGATCIRRCASARPHRAALPSAEAAAQLRAEVRAGRLDGDAVEAVLATAGSSRSPATRGPGRPHRP